MGAYRIDLEDALHAVCALRLGVGEIISNDRGFDRVKEILGYSSHTLKLRANPDRGIPRITLVWGTLTLLEMKQVLMS